MSAPYLDPATATEVAVRIGYRIARRALHHADRATWLEAIPTMPGQNPAASRTCGPDIYGGTAGIGWYLAELAVRAPDPLFERIARAALRQAAARAEAHVGLTPHGFYGGRPGTAVALIAAGMRLDDAASIAAGRRLLASQTLVPDAPDATDLISGLAGTALALAIGADALADGDLAERARDVALALIGLAHRDARGLSWPTMSGARANLTGFAHGTAGIAHALLVVDALAPSEPLRTAAIDALRYEEACYDGHHRGWPDYRVLPGYPPEQIFYPVAWCHGAAGIALMRLAARRGDVGDGAALDAAVTATVVEAARLRGTPGIDHTLCHGVLGLADTLLDAARAGREDAAITLISLLDSVKRTYHDGEQPWPSGLATREEISGLMLGTAGIGWLFLRVADATLGSPLLPGASILTARG
ncbi:lanthionine synthetase LanC family protein [Sphingomonas sp.]|uniref:lanthionine synthetase LanC family protein n=1 Tax=Sphingomonas sp. TaxID=28214 RepID=UPI0028A8D156|nr:lanthionine synthetase LanC family protein [Sphingomonas sp.]